MTDSKLAKQAALPRRQVFRRMEIAELHARKITDPLLSGIVYKNGKLQPPKKKRKSQAKVKR